MRARTTRRSLRATVIAEPRSVRTLAEAGEPQITDAESPSDLESEVTQECAFEGAVLDERGSPVVGVRVFFDGVEHSVETLTGPDGRFRMPVGAGGPGAAGALGLVDPRGVYADRSLLAWRVPEHDVEVEMPRAAAVVGRFVPRVPSAKLDVGMYWDGEWEDGTSHRNLKTKTNSDGTFRIADLPWGIPLRLTMGIPGRAPVFCGPLNVEKGQVVDLGAIAAPVGFTVELEITGAAGEPVPGAWAELSIAEWEGSRFAQADASGLVRLPRLPERQGSIRVGAEKYLRRTIPSPRIAPRFRRVVELQPASVLEGDVIGGDGRPFAGRTVTLYEKTRIEDFERSRWIDSKRSDAEGRFCFYVRGGRYRVECQGGDATPFGCDVTVFAADRKRVRIEMR